MSSKRKADKYITDQNWDQEDEVEEAGNFEPASKDVIGKRTIKKAKRRMGKQSENASAFKGFSGLKTTKASEKSNGFQGFKLHSTTSVFTLPKEFSEKRRLIIAQSFSSDTLQEKILLKSSTKNGANKGEMFSKKGNASEGGAETHQISVKETKFLDPDEDVPKTQKMSQYNQHLAALNKSVSKWISEHVEKDPLCDLSPVFDDYQQHFSNIEDKYGAMSSSASDSSQDIGEERELSHSPLSKVPIPFQSARAKTPPKNPLGISKPASSASPFTGFGVTRDLPSTSTGGFTGFQFSSKMVAAPADTATTVKEAPSSTPEEEEYVPPQPDSNTVEEKDAFYTKKCKLFYMKDGAYADRGVGHIHLKPVASSKKTQLIIRADTSLGNLLLNIVLNSAMPVAKQGKNNVVISCVPNPPIDEKNSDKVVPMLVRVKTSEDADQLIEILNEKKSECD